MLCAFAYERSSVIDHIGEGVPSVAALLTLRETLPVEEARLVDRSRLLLARFFGDLLPVAERFAFFGEAERWRAGDIDLRSATLLLLLRLVEAFRTGDVDFLTGDTDFFELDEVRLGVTDAFAGDGDLPRLAGVELLA